MGVGYVRQRRHLAKDGRLTVVWYSHKLSWEPLGQARETEEPFPRCPPVADALVPACGTSRSPPSPYPSAHSPASRMPSDPWRLLFTGTYQERVSYELGQIYYKVPSLAVCGCLVGRA